MQKQGRSVGCGKRRAGGGGSGAAAQACTAPLTSCYCPPEVAGLQQGVDGVHLRTVGKRDHLRPLVAFPAAFSVALTTRETHPAQRSSLALMIDEVHPLVVTEFVHLARRRASPASWPADRVTGLTEMRKGCLDMPRQQECCACCAEQHCLGRAELRHPHPSAPLPTHPILHSAKHLPTITQPSRTHHPVQAQHPTCSLCIHSQAPWPEQEPGQKVHKQQQQDAQRCCAP